MFITFEGGDGTGKSTQIQLLNSYFKNRGIKVLCSREPGGTEFAEKIRELVLHNNMALTTEVMLMFAARAEHVAAKIKPALEKNTVVLLDRYFDASFIYQGIVQGFEVDKLKQLVKWLNLPVPDITFIFDLSAETAKKRLQNRDDKKSDKFDNSAIGFFNKVRQGYLDLAKTENRFIQIDASLDKSVQHDLIVEYLQGIK